MEGVEGGAAWWWVVVWWCGGAVVAGGGRWRGAVMRTWNKLDLIVSGSKPSLLSRNFFRSWSRYSKTRVSFFSVWITSCSLPEEEAGAAVR